MRGLSSNTSSTPNPNSPEKRSPPHRPRRQTTYAALLALFFNRVFTLTLALGILGLSAAYLSAEGSDSGFGVPRELGYVVACATLTLPVSLYLALTNAPKPVLHKERGLGKLALSLMDGLMAAMWIAAAAVSPACAPGFCNEGRSATGLAAVMAFFFAWALALDLFTGAAGGPGGLRV